VAIFTGFLVVLGGLQLFSFIQSERAFLSISALETAGNAELKAGDLVNFTAQIKNSGRSTAFISSLIVNVAIYDMPLPEVPPYKAGATNVRGPIVAGGIKVANLPGISAEEKPIALSQVHADGIRDGKFNIYMFGKMDYSDEFPWFGNKIT
jgi:cold shock CspA family protein